MTGRVTLVGGGPGRADLLTVAAVRALGEADVVLYDRLAPHEALAEFAPTAELVDVGKRPGHHALPQHAIEALLVEHALAGRHAVRLKGGDPYVLGRGSEEVLACHRVGVPVDVIPGVTSAVAVPGAAGIPLTHRGMSHLFTVVSGHAPLSTSELEHLAGLGGTIVVLMGVNTLPSLTAGLARFGMSPGMPVAIVERGFRADQRTTIGELCDIVFAAGRAGVTSPAVVVIGEVVRLAHDGDSSAAELIDRAAAFAGIAS
ncbi:MAG TPA: uroporphyrinogen-III C-methyltransferase [Agromyces sp.]|nr:uroporphyrinogen-III C-methyltransferase [Agromyces sp.]